MTTEKEIVANFYENDSFLSEESIQNYLHPNAIIYWNSSKEYLQLQKNDLILLGKDLRKSYTKMRLAISHIIQEKKEVVVRYTHYVNTIENPKEEIILAHFVIIWKLKDNLLHTGFQMSQLDH